MGNCLVLQKEHIKIMKTDGEILEYKAPMKVHELLSQYPGHAISATLPVIQHLQPDTDMHSGHLYYLLPLPVVPSTKMAQKVNVRHSNSNISNHQKQGEEIIGCGGVRIKLVISKKELELMLRKGGGGGVSVNDLMLLSNLQTKLQVHVLNEMDTSFDNITTTCTRWKPVLQSIPEII